VKSNIKREDVLRYITKQFNSNTQGLTFKIGSETNPLFKPITKEADGNINDFDLEFNYETYQLNIKNHIPVAVLVSEGDYASLANLDQTERITSASWSVAVSMFLFYDSQVHDKLLFAVEEARDKFLSKLDFLEARELNYAVSSAKPTVKYYKVVTTAGDITPNSVITVSGYNYMEYTFAVDLEVADSLHMANQFEYYLGYEKNNQGVIQYHRVLPLIASWGASNTLTGHQVLRNKALTEANQKLSKMIHNLVTTRGFGIGFTFLFENRNIIMELFKQSYVMNDKLNKEFYIKVKFLNEKRDINNKPYFAEDTSIGFEYTCVLGEIATSDMSYGENVMFNVGFAPSWVGVNNGS
jgi:hypothetical protein